MESFDDEQNEVLLHYGSTDNEESYWKPEFLIKDESSAREYKYEWRNYLVEKNLEQISSTLPQNIKGLRFSFYNKLIVKKVFDICKILKQPPEVRYLALDILDRFMITHFFDINHKVNENYHGSRKLWKTITTRMSSQSLLRALSSIQLASKYCRNFKAITKIHIQEILAASGQKYMFTKYDIMKSEVRILKSINCKIPAVTPLTYIEMFFEDFDNEQMKKHLHLTLASFLNICVDILDIVITYHQEIFHTFYTKVTGKPFLIFKDPQFLTVEADYMYLAVCVINTAAILQDPTKATQKELWKFFGSITQYKMDEIESLGMVILNFILEL